MTDDGLDRVDALELAVVQLADAMEVMAGVVATGFTRSHLQPVLDQLEAARRLVGTSGE